MKKLFTLLTALSFCALTITPAKATELLQDTTHTKTVAKHKTNHVKKTVVKKSVRVRKTVTKPAM